MCFEENPIILPAPVSLYKWVVKKKLNAEITFVDMTATKTWQKRVAENAKLDIHLETRKKFFFFFKL